MSDVEMITEFDSASSSKIKIDSLSKAVVEEEKTEFPMLYDIAKRIFDFCISILLILMLLPMICALCLVLRFIQGGPVLISHRRIGKGGRSFPCLKFRTMVTNADQVLAQHLTANPGLRAEWESTRKLRKDPRITPFGRILRKTSIDEIPQLLNIIRGDMSLVGPRPITINETDFYGIHLGAYTSVRPGLTGLWQVSGRSETSYAERVQLDARYVENRSLSLDLVILCKTFLVITSSRGSY